MSVIDNLLRREDATLSGTVTVDAGGRTQYGIAELHNPEAWADGKVTLDEARSIFQQKYIDAPGFNKVVDERLREQLIDFGVNSGPRLAIMKLQLIVGAEIDGVLGPETLDKLNRLDYINVNNQLAIQRILMIGRLVQKRPSDLDKLSGWLNRATSFIV